MAQGGHPATPTAPTGPLGPQSPHHHHPGFPVAAPRVSRSKMPMAAPVRHHLPGHNGPQGSPVKFNPHMFHPNLSGSETDVSTSTENLTQVEWGEKHVFFVLHIIKLVSSQEERFLLRHMEREEPQGEETGDALASFAHLQRSAGGLSAADISAIISHRYDKSLSPLKKINVAYLDLVMNLSGNNSWPHQLPDLALRQLTQPTSMPKRPGTCKTKCGLPKLQLSPEGLEVPWCLAWLAWLVPQLRTQS